MAAKSFPAIAGPRFGAWALVTCLREPTKGAFVQSRGASPDSAAIARADAERWRTLRLRS